MAWNNFDLVTAPQQGFEVLRSNGAARNIRWFSYRMEPPRPWSVSDRRTIVEEIYIRTPWRTLDKDNSVIDLSLTDFAASKFDGRLGVKFLEKRVTGDPDELKVLLVKYELVLDHVSLHAIQVSGVIAGRVR